MNGILSNNSENKLQGILFSKNNGNESIETAGSLAMGLFDGWFSNNSYDEFVSSNPFAVDYSMYANCGDCVAYSGFLSSFSNAISTLGSFGGEVSCGGDFGGGCSGGFTSVC